MAFLRFTGADAPFNMVGTKFDGSIPDNSPTQWKFATSTNGLAIASGEALTFDQVGAPTGGTVNALQLRLGARDAFDALVSDFSVAATALASSDNVWDVILAGNDVINTGALTAENVGSGTSFIFGDASEARNGASGGNDTFLLGNAALNLSGDAMFISIDFTTEASGRTPRQLAIQAEMTASMASRLTPGRFLSAMCSRRLAEFASLEATI